MRVLELSRGPAAAYAGLLLAELQFEVDRLDLGAGAPDPFLHRGKREAAVPIDLECYDALVEDVGADGLRSLGWSYAKLRRRRPDLVLVSLSAFGLAGPRSHWQATELTVQAAGGVLHCSGYDGEPPVKLPGDTAAMICGLHGATAVVSGLFGVHQGGERGVHIDISAQDAFMHHWTRHLAHYAYSGVQTRRGERQPKGIHAVHTARARDGWLYMMALRVPWQDVAAFLGLGDHVTADESAEQPWDEMQEAFHAAVASRGRYDWFTDAAAMGWTFAPVEEPGQLMASPQNAARGFFRDHEVEGRTLAVPGLPFRFE